MTKTIIVVALILALIYFYYQNRKKLIMPHSSSSDNSSERDIVGDIEKVETLVKETTANLIADRDQAIRSKNEAEAETLSLSNKLRNKQQEVNRKDQENERLKKEKSQVEIALNQKIKELKKDNEDLKNKYSKQVQLLDEEQTENNKLTEKIEELETEIQALTNRPKSPIPGEFPQEKEGVYSELSQDKEQLIRTHQEQLRKINLLFDEKAANYENIDFNGLYSLLEEEVKKKKKTIDQPPIYSRQRKQKK